MGDLLKFLTNNATPIDTLVNILGFLCIPIAGAILAVLSWFILKWWLRRAKTDVPVFDVIADPKVLLPRIYGQENDASPLADCNIQYVRRDPQSDVQADLRRLLNPTSRYLLITGRTGMGKTREAATLAYSLMGEGLARPRVKSGWLGEPRVFPPELGQNRSPVLIFLDDLNMLFSAGAVAQSPKLGDAPSLGQPSYHDRLLQVLNYFERVCGEQGIRVLATARSEAHEWARLDYDQHDALWKRFELFELPEPTTNAVVDVLDKSVARAGLDAEHGDFHSIALENDGTFKNIVLNLRRTQNENLHLTRENYIPSLAGSWREVYESARLKHPPVSYIYDAIDLLRQTRIDLYPFLVEPSAGLIWGGTRLQRAARRRHLRRALNYLVAEQVLTMNDGQLSPHDGQIEAKGALVNAQQYLLSTSPYSALTRLILRVADRHPTQSVASLLRFGAILYNAKQFEQARLVWEKGAKIASADRADAFWSNLGVVLDDNMQRYADAEAAYRKAIDLNPNYATAYYNLGLLLHEKSQRYPDAEAAYRKAIDLNPNDADAYNNLGNLLAKDSQRYADADAAYRKAIDLNPNYATAYNNLGNLLAKDSQRYADAEAAYRKAIELNPNYADAYNNLGALLDDMQRYADAEAAYRKAIDLNPNDAAAYYNLGNLLDDMQRYADAEAAYRKAIELNPNFATAYNNLGNLLAKDSQRYADAEAAYRKAIDLNPNDATAYNNLGAHLAKDSQRYADADAAYRKAIDLNPNYATAYNNLGNLLAKDSQRYADAEAAYRKAIELNPTYAHAVRNLGHVLRLSNKLDQAISYFKKSQELEPRFVSLIDLAGTYRQLANLDESLRYVSEARALALPDDWYNLACLESIAGNANAAFEHLRRAAQQEKFNRGWAWKDWDLEWIRNDPRFIEIVGPQPAENSNP